VAGSLIHHDWIIYNVSKYDVLDFLSWSLFEHEGRHQEHLTNQEQVQLETFVQELNGEFHCNYMEQIVLMLMMLFMMMMMKVLLMKVAAILATLLSICSKT
jgi:hypothetical protein